MGREKGSEVRWEVGRGARVGRLVGREVGTEMRWEVGRGARVEGSC